MSQQVKRESFYVTCTSSKCRQYFPNNKTSSFTTRLREPIVLDNRDRKWQVGVSSFVYSQAINNFGPCADTELYLYDGYQLHTIAFEDQHLTSVADVVKAIESGIHKYIADWNDIVYSENAEKEEYQYDPGAVRKRVKREGGISHIYTLDNIRNEDDMLRLSDTEFTTQFEQLVEGFVARMVYHIRIAAFMGYGILNSPKYSKFMGPLLIYHAYVCSHTYAISNTYWIEKVVPLFMKYQGTKLARWKTTRTFSAVLTSGSVYSLYRYLNQIRNKFLRYFKGHVQAKSYVEMFKSLNKGMAYFVRIMREEMQKSNPQGLTDCLDEATILTDDFYSSFEVFDNRLKSLTERSVPVDLMQNVDKSYMRMKHRLEAIRDYMKNNLDTVTDWHKKEKFVKYIIHIEFIAKEYEHVVTSKLQLEYESVLYARTQREDEFKIKSDEVMLHTDDVIFTELYSNVDKNMDSMSKELFVATDAEKILSAEDIAKYEKIKHADRFWRSSMSNDEYDRWLKLFLWSEKRYTTSGNHAKATFLIEGTLPTNIIVPQATNVRSSDKPIVLSQVKETPSSGVTAEDKKPSPKPVISKVAPKPVISKVAQKPVISKVVQKPVIIKVKEPVPVIIKVKEPVPAVVKPINIPRIAPQEKTVKDDTSKQKVVDIPAANVSTQVQFDTTKYDTSERHQTVDIPIPTGIVTAERYTSERPIINNDYTDAMLKVSAGMYGFKEGGIKRTYTKSVGDDEKQLIDKNHIHVFIVGTKIHITFSEPYYDIALSPTLMKIMGFMDLPHLTLGELNLRLKLRKTLDLWSAIEMYRLAQLKKHLTDSGGDYNWLFFSPETDQARKRFYAETGMDMISFESRFQQLALTEGYTDVFKFFRERILSPQEYVRAARDIFSSETFTMYDAVIYKMLNESPMSIVEGTNSVSFTPSDMVFVYTNIIEPENVDDSRMRLLEMMSIRSVADGKIDQIEFSNTHYKTLDVDIITEVEIFIATSLGKPVPFRYGPATLQLHFRRAR